jgi:hypothetical protein
VDIPAIDIPAIDIPAMDTPAMVIPEFRVPEMQFEVPDYARISSADLRRYAKALPNPMSSAVTARAASRNQMAAVARNKLFISKYGNQEGTLVSIFAAADADQSGDLSWGELGKFQSSMYRRFSYKSNATALRPDDFVRQGGGDCEDWALLTAAFCDYWGWEAYVACFFGDSGDGHALCMVRAPARVPVGYTYWHVTSAQTLEGDALAEGDYVPVDYDQVGMLSNAVKAGETLRYFMTPMRTYGAPM